ncbi:MAG: hypothetical protein IPM45_02820 [Acidimicrobiales bacterium]|nr:hypothetical protein [Acidimicrobiales bacterium]
MSRPAVIFGGPSPEHDVSILTGLQAARALLDAGTAVEALYWSTAGEWFQVDPTLEASSFLGGVPARSPRAELVAGPGGGFTVEGRLGRRNRLDLDTFLVCCHGGPGEDGSLQAALDLAGLRYTGPSAPGAALGMDKLAFGGVVASAGLATLPRRALTLDGPAPGFEPPYIVKPRYGGSSIGIEVVENLDTARALLRTQPHLRAGAVVEPYLPDALDLNISVRTWPEPALSSIERPLRRNAAGAIYTYADKYLGGEGLSSAPRELPAQVPEAVTAGITGAARVLVDAAAVRGVARIDFLWSGDDVWVNEINTIPGALAWYFWAERGLPIAGLLSALLDEAAQGPARVWSVEGADGTALRAAGSIASKLA